MKAHLRSVRIAPKKLNLVADMIRGALVPDAVEVLRTTNKKAARILEQLLRSAMSNAQHNDSQNSQQLLIKEVVVNKAQAYHRGIPMSRGRMRRIKKYLSHASITLGLPEVDLGTGASKSETKAKTSADKPAAKKPAAEKSTTATKKASQETKKQVKSSSSKSTSSSKKASSKSTSTSTAAKKTSPSSTKKKSASASSTSSKKS